MKTIIVPRSALVLPVGIAGCGKSTFIFNQMNDEIGRLSADDFRLLITDDMSNQQANGDVFFILNHAVNARMRLGRSTVVDNTNVTAASRRDLIGHAKRWGRRVVAIVFRDSDDVVKCYQRTLDRGRCVPLDIIERQHEVYKREPVTADEGFDAVYELTADDRCVVYFE